MVRKIRDKKGNRKKRYFFSGPAIMETKVRKVQKKRKYYKKSSKICQFVVFFRNLNFSMENRIPLLPRTLAFLKFYWVFILGESDIFWATFCKTYVFPTLSFTLICITPPPLSGRATIFIFFMVSLFIFNFANHDLGESYCVGVPMVDYGKPQKKSFFLEARPLRGAGGWPLRKKNFF